MSPDVSHVTSELQLSRGTCDLTLSAQSNIAMSCPNYIQDLFNKIKHPDLENSWYGPWNAVLSDFFPAREGFEVAPQGSDTAVDRSRNSVDFVVNFIITHHEIPVLFVEVKPPFHLENISTRESADDQMRQRFRTLYSPDVELRGISAMGTQFALYYIDRDEVFPRAIPRSNLISNDVAPLARWNQNLLGDGYRVLKGEVDSIKGVCAELSHFASQG